MEKMFVLMRVRLLLNHSNNSVQWMEIHKNNKGMIYRFVILWFGIIISSSFNSNNAHKLLRRNAEEVNEWKLLINSIKPSAQLGGNIQNRTATIASTQLNSITQIYMSSFCPMLIEAQGSCIDSMTLLRFFEEKYNF